MDRNIQVEHLIQYQTRKLSTALSQLHSIDQEITTLEQRIALETNLGSSARGLVGRRIKSSISSALRTRNHVSAKQRFWIESSGEISGDTRRTTLPNTSVPTIGVIYSKFSKRFEAPRQSFTGPTGRATIFLDRQFHDTRRSRGLELPRIGSLVGVLYWFDRNCSNWRLFVTPPRSKNSVKLGVFATRSPNRPSPVGLSFGLVKGVCGDKGLIEVDGVDILDETPLIGFKSYDGTHESHSDAKCGWIEENTRVQPLYYDCTESDCEGRADDFEVEFVDDALGKIKVLTSNSVVDMESMIEESLRKVMGGARYGVSSGGRTKGNLAVGAFRVLYECDSVSGSMRVTDIVSGMRLEVCEEEAEVDPEAKLHLALRKYRD